LDEINSTKSLEFADLFLVFIDAFELGNSIRPYLRLFSNKSKMEEMKLTRFEELLSIKIEPFMQDWDIELADAARVEEFCDVYERQFWAEQEKSDLMRLIVASYDDALREGKVENQMWERISHLLKRDYDLHKDTIQYWSLMDEEDEENLFPATSFVREVWRSCESK